MGAVKNVLLRQLVGKGLEPLADDDVEGLVQDRSDDEAPAKADDSFGTRRERVAPSARR